MAKVIMPTIGRRLWFWESGAKRLLAQSNRDVQPEDAGVCYVHGERCVNLSVVNQNGFIRSRTSVPLIQDGDPWNESTGEHCTWMPFQLGQVAPPKTIE